jgi:hypothetical protein
MKAPLSVQSAQQLYKDWAAAKIAPPHDSFARGTCRNFAANSNHALQPNPVIFVSFEKAAASKV